MTAVFEVAPEAAAQRPPSRPGMPGSLPGCGAGRWS